MKQCRSFESEAKWSVDPRPASVARRKAPQTRGLNLNRHPLLKSAFKGAALVAVVSMPEHPLHQAYQAHVKQRMEPALGRLTLARRIAAAMLAMWKKQESYDPTKHTSQT